MDIPTLSAKAQSLSDCEHALLLSLMAKKHCILETEAVCLDQLASETEAVNRIQFSESVVD